MNKHSNSVLSSFRFAFSGIWEFFRQERNARIHLLAAAAVIVLGFIFRISGYEWIVLVIMIMSVMTAEAMNTAIEKLCNHVNPGIHPDIRTIKDLSAGAVLLAALASIIVAAIIFIPKFLSI